MRRWWEIFRVALKLGLTSFGGPVAHLGFFHAEYVTRRRWLDEKGYADLVALCQALPGPASSQVGMAVGQVRGGPAGAVAAWLGFTLPSALLMVGFGFLWEAQASVPGFDGLVRGLSWVAFAVVTQALWTLGRQLVTGWGAALLAAMTAVGSALAGSPGVTLALLAGSGLAGALWFRDPGAQGPVSPPGRKARVWGAACLGLFGALLLLLPLARVLTGSPLVSLFDSLYRTGALVFGGGHVVLPLLQTELVAPGSIDAAAFLAGYGAAQAVPGPLFTLSGYLGFLAGGIPGAMAALAAVFLPSLLLVWGVGPFWEGWKHRAWFRRSLAGLNAAVVGLLAWAWVHPVGTQAVHGLFDLGAVAVLGAALIVGKLPPWAVVAAGALAGVLAQAASIGS